MNRDQSLTAEELDLLRKADTPTICNVIELFNVRPHNTGYMDARIQCCFPEMPPMVGYATTSTLRTAGAPMSGGPSYGGLERQLEQLSGIAQPPIIVFQDLDNPSAAATFGEGMCGIYQAFGSVGLITSGTGRDLQQVRALDYPVFTSGTICSHGYIQILESGTPVHVGGLTVYPGDLLHGDCNGVTSIPHAIASEVAQLCAPFMKAEEHFANFAKRREADIKKMIEARSAARAEMQVLRERARAFVAKLPKSA